MKVKPVVASLVMLGLMTPAFAKYGIASQQAVVDKNSVVSPVCSKGWFDRISFSGLGSIIAIYGNHDPAGSFTNIGSGSDMYVNNFNLLANAELSCWSKATLNLAYLGAPNPWNNLAQDDDYDTVSYRMINHGIVADEAYVTIANFNKYPFYLKVGKTYVPFGDYLDPYIPYQIMSPAQMIAQTNAAAAIAGFSTDFGLYGSLYAFKGETFPVDSNTQNIKNFGFKVGYYDHLDAFNVPNAHVNFVVSYLHNIWDSQFFSPNPYTKWRWATLDISMPDSDCCEPLKRGYEGYAKDPVGAVSVHGDLAYKAFSIYADWVTALKDMYPGQINGLDYTSKFWGANVNAAYAFKTFDRDSSLGAGIQISGNGTWFSALGMTDHALMVPKVRYLGEYKVNLFKNTDLSVVVAHGKSFDFDGINLSPTSDRTTTLGLARLMFQF